MMITQHSVTSTTVRRGETLTAWDADGLRYAAPFRWRPRATSTARRTANAPGTAEASV